jgi:hypothetical protein
MAPTTHDGEVHQDGGEEGHTGQAGELQGHEVHGHDRCESRDEEAPAQEAEHEEGALQVDPHRTAPNAGRADDEEVTRMAEKKIAPAKPSAEKAEKSSSKAAATRVTKRKNFKKVHAK